MFAQQRINFSLMYVTQFQIPLFHGNNPASMQSSHFLILLITPPSRPPHPLFFVAVRVTLFNPGVCFKPITWYLEMHHVRLLFLCACGVFFLLNDVHLQQFYLQEERLTGFLRLKGPLRIFPDHILSSADKQPSSWQF